MLNDPERRDTAGIPETVQFATKPPPGQGGDPSRAGRRDHCPWVTGDEAYGQDPQLRATLEARGIGYVLAIASRWG
ncbi:transposase [Streptomyces sp. NPDC007851]|uniref:transposase n=1 Tax=Streptomyces sp. NPDC007851 TaxID=3155008 RepID=UPI0033C490A8